jgi:hypothetical protein
MPNEKVRENESLECIHELTGVVGGIYDGQKCFDTMVAWGGPAALLGAVTSGGNPGVAAASGVVGAASGFLDSPNCGDGTNTPMNQIHNWFNNLKVPTDMPEPQWNALTA